MRYTRIEDVTVTKELPVSIQCDCCKKEFTYGNGVDVSEDIFELQEFLSLRRTGGYGSVFGDMNTWTLDLCQQCQKKLFGHFINYVQSDFEDDWI